MIELQRVYEHSRTHGTRFLVERLWPRGIRKESLHFSDGSRTSRPAMRCAVGSELISRVFAGESDGFNRDGILDNITITG